MPKPYELLAPGGSLDQAAHALRAGADAIYCGAPRFSARSHAKNLDFSQLRRLCGEAAAGSAHPGQAARVYLALNTVIRRDELTAALETAWQAWEAGVSALIVQDLGLIRALQLFGPPLPLHASTQMAIHSAGGASAAGDLGLSRVVLARELSLKEIAAIIAAVPELEYECFIHGAMCYGVSGICLASGLLLGRSGNRGDCGQICRTWSRLEDDPADAASGQVTPGQAAAGQAAIPGAGFWFSMNDMSQSAAIRDLAAIGVNSFKIEGRMKPPEWTAAVVRHYRQLLDKPGSAPDQASLQESRTVFGRNPSGAFLQDQRGIRLINNQHAGSTGVPIGTILEASGNRILVKSALPLAVKDGIQLIRPGQPPELLRFGIQGLELPATRLNQAPGPASSAAAGKPTGTRALFSSPAGEMVWIITCETRFTKSDLGLGLSKIADHASNLALVKPESLPLHHHGLIVSAKLGSGLLGSELQLSTLLLSTRIAGGPLVEFAFKLEVSASDSPDGLASSLASQLAKADDSPFGLLRLETDSSLAGRFVSPKELKSARRAWYACLAEAFAKQVEQSCASLDEALGASTLPGPEPTPELQPAPESQPAPAQLSDPAPMPDLSTPMAAIAIPCRSRLSPQGQLPFATNPVSEGLAHWQQAGQDWLVIPLPPVVFDEESYLNSLKGSLAKLKAGSGVLFGLNNLAHLSWYANLRRWNHSQATGVKLAAFGDYGLYVANPLAALSLQDQIPDLLWLTPWVEEARLSGRSGATAPNQARPDLKAGATAPNQAPPDLKAAAPTPEPPPAPPPEPPPGNPASNPALPMAPFDPDFHPPLFISRACFRRSSLGLGCPAGGPEACPKKFEYQLRQGEKNFKVIVRDCLSYTFGS